MNLNGKQLVEQGIITNVPEENITQHGSDLNLIKVERLTTIGKIPKTGKTTLPIYEEVKLNSNNEWELQPGHYNITFSQGCNLPNNQMVLIRQRSSIARCGAIIHSSIFDSGFCTNQIGTLMTVIHTICIEEGARVAQAYAHICNPVENLYNGQFQNDKQRK